MFQQEIEQDTLKSDIIESYKKAGELRLYRAESLGIRCQKAHLQNKQCRSIRKLLSILT